jgi:predicted HicB family RNase H-like nuclease
LGRINIEISEELHKKLKVEAALKSTTIIELINKAIEEELKKK